MKIGFYMIWPKGSLSSRHNVIGDELYAESLCKALRNFSEVESAELYTPKDKPSEKIDVMIYINTVPPFLDLAEKHVLYMQNAYPKGAYEVLKEFRRYSYDGYMFISKRLLDLQKRDGFDGIFLPFGVDTSSFFPHEQKKEYNYDVSYIGNDIKGDRTDKYLLPGIKFNFGLFGNWPQERDSVLAFFKSVIKIILGKESFTKYIISFYKQKYKKYFYKISKGKIKQEDVPSLYSSSKVNLNCTAQDCVDWDVITLRVFEVLACRGFLISDKTPIAEEILKNCVIFTDGGQDLEKKIEFYLKNKEVREKIAEDGYNFVVKNATIEIRAKELLNYIKTINK